MIFKSDPSTALAKTKQRIVNVDSNIEALKARRQELLATPDDDNVADIAAINKSIEAEQANRAIYEAKVIALAEEVRRGEYHSREKQRKKAIEEIAAKLERRTELASEIELAVARLGHLFSQLVTPDEIERFWPFPRPGGGFAVLDRRGIDKELGWAMYGLCREHRFPEPNSIGLGVTGISALGVTELIRQHNESIIAKLEMAPIAEDLLEEPAA
jgi:hypothetical protein